MALDRSKASVLAWYAEQLQNPHLPPEGQALVRAKIDEINGTPEEAFETEHEVLRLRHLRRVRGVKSVTTSTSVYLAGIEARLRAAEEAGDEAHAQVLRAELWRVSEGAVPGDEVTIRYVLMDGKDFGSGEQ